MTEQQLEKVTELFDSGYKITLSYSPGFAKIRFDGRDWTIDDGVFPLKKLIDVKLSDLRFFKEVRIEA